MAKLYTKKTWKNEPSTETPINAENLNHIENGIDAIDTRVDTNESALNAVGAALDSKADTSAIPTKTSDLTNDSGFQTALEVSTALDGYVPKDGSKVLSTNDYDNAEKAKVATAIQPDDIDTEVVTQGNITQTATDVTVTNTSVNLKTGVANSHSYAMPIASAAQAGVINAATYQSILQAISDIAAISGEAVAVSGLSATPTQAELTTAWQTALSTTNTPNSHAYIWETDNKKGWTYFDNTSTWEVTQVGTGATVSIDVFNNTTAGTIKGSDVDGQIHAETDGTGSVNGWDDIVADMGDLKTDMTSVQSSIGSVNTNISTINANIAQLSSDKADRADMIPDSALSLTSKRTVENQAVSNALSQIGNLDEVKYSLMWNLEKKAIVITDNSTGIQQELVLTGLATLADVGSST